MRKLLIGTAAALTLIAGSAMAQGAGGGGGGGEQNTTVPRAGQSTMSPGSSGTSGGNWSAGNPGGTTAGSGVSGTTNRGMDNRGSVSTTGDIDARSSATTPGQGQTYDTLKQGRSGSSGSSTTTTTTGSSKPAQAKPSRSPQDAQRATGTHCPPGSPDCRPGSMSGR